MDNSHTEQGLQHRAQPRQACWPENPSKRRRPGQDESLIPANPIAAPILLPEIKSTKRLRITAEKRREINGVDPPQLALQLKRQM